MGGRVMSARSKGKRPITVLKFGSSILRDEGDLLAVVAEIGALVAACHRVVAVVSAMGGSTDDLLGRAGRVCSDPDSAPWRTLVGPGPTLLESPVPESSVPES